MSSELRITIRRRLALLLVGLLLAACADGSSQALAASGTVEAVEISVASELGGKVAEVMIEEGAEVSAGQPLFRLENDQLQSQHQQAQAALAAARSTLTAAEAGKATAEAALQSADTAIQAAQLQAHLTLSLARSQEAPVRQQAWSQSLPSEFDLPGWYFQQPEQIDAAQAAVSTAEASLRSEQQNLAELVAELGGGALAEAQTRLLNAQAAFTVIDQLQDRSITGADRRFVRDALDDLKSAAEDELESAQEAFDDLISDSESEDLLEAHARVAVAQERLVTAQTGLDQLRTGEYSLEVQAAFVVLDQAQAQRGQAEAGLAQAEAQLAVARSMVGQARSALAFIESQLEKLTVTAPASGVVLNRLTEPGELIQAGVPAITIGQLDDLRITVYLPEDRYGQIALGDAATVSVDSYPEVAFEASVMRIADQAEFTPRNVQTEQERRSTVYAVVLSVQDPDGMLVPGMPADVEFDA